jgi:hypothetical protein
MRTITSFLAGALLIATTAQGVMAAERNPINKRQHSEQVRIRQGVKSGELTAAERMRIQRSLISASQDIYQHKHDGQDRK